MTVDELKAHRSRFGLSQAQMAEHLFLGMRQYQEIEAGRATIKPEHVALLELASMRLALLAHNIDLALPRIRRDALDFAAMVRGV